MAPLGIGGCQRAAQPVGLHALRERHGRRGADRERAQHLLVVLAEHAPDRSVIKRGQQTDRVAAVDHRHEQRGLSVGTPNSRGAIRRRAATSVIRSGRPRSSTCPEVESATGRRTPRVSSRVSGAGLHDQLIPVAQHDHEATGAHERTAALDDQLEHVLKRYLPADRDSDVARGLKATEGLLKLLAAPLADLVQPRVLDRDSRPPREHHDGLLVGLGELAVLLVGEIQVAPHLPADRGRARRESCASPDGPAGNP